MDRDYDEESDGSEWMLSEIGESRKAIPFEGWGDFHLPNGYRFVDSDDREEYMAWLETPGNEGRLKAWLDREAKEMPEGEWE